MCVREREWVNQYASRDNTITKTIVHVCAKNVKQKLYRNDTLMPVVSKCVNFHSH